MLKNTLFGLAVLTFFACQNAPLTPGDATHPPVYAKSDLQKLGWIRGTWKSEVSGTGYYQTFHFPSDSVLEIVSYQFDGKDTSGTTAASVYWKNDHLYMGPNGEWVAVLLDQGKFQLDPIHSGWHSISWTKNSADQWTFEQQKTDFKRTITMKRQPELSTLLQQ